MIHRTHAGVGLPAALLLLLALATAAPAQADETSAPSWSRQVLAQEIAVPPDPAATVTLRRPPAQATRWDLTLEAGVSLIDDPEGIMGEPVPAGVTPFRWDLNDYDAAIGGRGTLGYRISGRDRLEVRGTFWGHFDASSRQTGNFAFRPTPGAAAALSPVASATLTSETDVWGGEFNWWRSMRCDPCWQIDVGLGIRYLRFDDEARASNWQGLRPNAFLKGEVENAFLGGQLMAAYHRHLVGRLELGVSAKGLLGAMNRDMKENDTSIVTGGATTNATREETDFSWGVEAEVSLFFGLSKNVGLTASYTFLYLDEISRAASALDFSQAATGSVQLRDQTESAMVHSLFLGIRLDL